MELVVASPCVLVELPAVFHNAVGSAVGVAEAGGIAAAVPGVAVFGLAVGKVGVGGHFG